jgi:hypothetical protein
MVERILMGSIRMDEGDVFIDTVLIGLQHLDIASQG